MKTGIANGGSERRICETSVKSYSRRGANGFGRIVARPSLILHVSYLAQTLLTAPVIA